jgi:VanZ family protein
MADPEGTTPGLSRAWTALRLWGPPFMLYAVIFALSSTPGNRFPDHPEFANIAFHFMEFALLASLIARALTGLRLIKPWLLLGSTIFFCTVLGFLAELIQFTVPQRTFDFMDLLYDLLGALFGSLFYLGWGKKPGVVNGARKRETRG